MGAIAELPIELPIKAKLNIPEPTAIPSDMLWRLSVAQYHTMLQVGILEEGDRLELLEGILVAKMTKNPPHRISTKLIREALENITPDSWYVDSQEPITLDDSEPEPDVVIIRGKTTDYRDRHPVAADVVLVIEVADSTLERDRTTKQRIYARAGIAIYWILNLRDRQLEVYTEPLAATSEAEAHYGQCTIFAETASVSVFWLDGSSDREFGVISVQSLL
jgi:Uma2 family endonuclease